MKVLFFTPTNIYSNLAEIELEIAQRHIDSGDEVHGLVCNANLSFCEINKTHSFLQCRYCKYKHKNSFESLSGNVQVHNLSQYFSSKENVDIPQNIEFATIDDLKKYKWKQYFDVGYSVGSYLITEYRDPYLDIKPHSFLIQTLLTNSIKLYTAVRLFLQKNSFDKVYVWNGRMPSMRPIIRAAQSLNISFATYNTASIPEKFETFSNSLIHDLSATAKKIIDYWNNHELSIEVRINIATKFYLNRQSQTSGNSLSANPYIANQKAEELPHNWDNSKINIVIFNSSEDEMASISDEWKNELYINQYDAICKLLESTRNKKFNNYHFYLRLHPNLINVNNEDTQRLLNLKASNLTVILPDSIVSSYHLMKVCNKVITFGSFSGMEAVFIGTPSIIIGKHFYLKMPGGTYKPTSHTELIELLLQPLPPLDKTPALMYGFFWSTFGTDLKYVTQQNGEWLFKGKKLRSHFVYETLKKIKEKLR